MGHLNGCRQAVLFQEDVEVGKRGRGMREVAEFDEQRRSSDAADFNANLNMSC